MKTIAALFIAIFTGFLFLKAEGNIIQFTEKNFAFNEGEWLSKTPISPDDHVPLTLTHPHAKFLILSLEYNAQAHQLVIGNIGQGRVKYLVYDHETDHWTGLIEILPTRQHVLSLKKATLYLSIY